MVLYFFAIWIPKLYADGGRVSLVGVVEPYSYCSRWSRRSQTRP